VRERGNAGSTKVANTHGAVQEGWTNRRRCKTTKRDGAVLRPAGHYALQLDCCARTAGSNLIIGLVEAEQTSNVVVLR